MCGFDPLRDSRVYKTVQPNQPRWRSMIGLSMGNYRPISVLPVLSKVIELVVHQQLYIILKKTNSSLINNMVFGVDYLLCML